MVNVIQQLEEQIAFRDPNKSSRISRNHRSTRSSSSHYELPRSSDSESNGASDELKTSRSKVKVNPDPIISALDQQLITYFQEEEKEAQQAITS